jgi:hypothetical protein
LKVTDNEGPADTNEPYAFKKIVQGSFIVDSEAGPYVLGSSDWDLNRAKLKLTYNKTSSSGSLSSVASLLIQCDRQLDGSCIGTATALGIDIGSFSMVKRSGALVDLVTVPKYVGHWHGKMTYDPIALAQMAVADKAFGNPVPPPVVDIDIELSAVEKGDVANSSSKWVLDTTPKRVGLAWLADDMLKQVYQFTTVNIDYFSRKMELTYAPTTTNGGFQTEFSIEADFTEDGTITGGVVSSTNFAKMGTFTAEKVQ